MMCDEDFSRLMTRNCFAQGRTSSREMDTFIRHRRLKGKLIATMTPSKYGIVLEEERWREKLRNLVVFIVEDASDKI